MSCLQRETAQLSTVTSDHAKVTHVSICIVLKCKLNIISSKKTFIGFITSVYLFEMFYKSCVGLFRHCKVVLALPMLLLWINSKYFLVKKKQKLKAFIWIVFLKYWKTAAIWEPLFYIQTFSVDTVSSVSSNKNVSEKYRLQKAHYLCNHLLFYTTLF